MNAGVTLTIEASWASHGTDGLRLQVFGADGGEKLFVAFDPAVQVGDKEAAHDATPGTRAAGALAR